MSKGKTVFSIILITLTLLLSACGKKGVGIDYGDAISFESALNNGENLEGKVVQFVAGEFHPDSVSGYDVWAGEHLNFISSRHPNIKEGDIVVVKVTEINNVLGSWLISYEKVENAVVTDSTIFSTTETTNASSDKSDSNVGKMNDGAGDISAIASTKSNEEITYEAVDGNIVAFKDYMGSKVSAYISFKNTSEYPIKAEDASFDYEDNSGKLLATDQYVHCIPEVINPGQIGYLYSYHFDVSDIDTSNGFVPNPQGKFVIAQHPYEIEVTDVSASQNYGDNVKVIGRGTNNSDENHLLAEPGAVLFDSEGKIIGFCWTVESFDAGQTKSFEITGDLMSSDFSVNDVDHVEVYIQGNEWF